MKKSSSTKKVAGTTTTTTTSTKATGNAAKTTTTTKAASSRPSTATKNGSDTPKTSTNTTTVKTNAVPSTPKPPPTPKTPKPPPTPKTPKAPLTPKTPKPPATPKTPKAPASSRPGTARPSTAKSTTSSTTTSSTKASSAVKKPSTTTTTTSTKPKTTTSTNKPTTTKATTSSTKAAKTTTTSTTTATTTTTKTSKASASRPATASSTLGGGESTARPVTPIASRPATGTKSTSSSSRPSTSNNNNNTTTTTTSSTSTTKKPPTPRDSVDIKAKSPRIPSDAGSKIARVPSSETHRVTRVPSSDKAKSPRHNVAAIGRANTAPDLLEEAPARPHLTTGSRSVSVGGLQSNITRAAPAGRRKPTVNPVKSRQATPLREQAPRERSAAGYMNGLGLLASVGNSEGPDFGQVQLRKVSDDKPKALLIHVKGRRNVTARATEPHHKSLNKGDAFVLVDAATRRIFEWRGALANKMEIAKAMDIAGRIKNKEFGGRAEVFVLEDGKTDHPGFWELIGGKGAIAAAEHAGDDEDEDKLVRQDYLFGVHERTQGKPELNEVARHKFNKEMLQPGQVYLIDCLTELYMWVGKNCANSHRSLVAAKAQEALTAVKQRPKWVTIVRIIEGAEPEIFKEKFCDWPSTLPITMAAVPKGNVAAKAVVKFDVASMLSQPKRDDKVIDDGTGKVEIWRVKDHTKDPVDPSMYGQFFDTESYVILYKYIVKNREVYIIYFWQGKHSSITEKGSSALLTIDLDDSIGGNATQIRVVQNKEPKHFMKLFKGFIIVHKAYETEDGASAVPETALYQIRGCNNVAGVGCDVRAVQLGSPSAKYLNTNDIFLLNTSEKQFIWRGANSSKFYNISEETLGTLGSTIKGSREQIFFNEGEEPAEFWENVGEAEYYKTAWTRFPRLFHCSSASGSFRVEEILEWDQEDLDPGHLNILDTSEEIFLWTGQRASIEEEKKQAMETVLDYAKLHPSRDQNVDNVLSVNAFRESFEFKAVFLCWDDSKSKSGENGVVKVTDLLKELSRPYTLAELRNPPKMLDSTKLETYLSVEEFINVFKMDKDAFAAQPLWKQEQQKKNVGLY